MGSSEGQERSEDVFLLIIIINASTDLIESLLQINYCPHSIIIVVNCFCHLSRYTRGTAFTPSWGDTLFPAADGRRCAYYANSGNPAHCYWVKKKKNHASLNKFWSRGDKSALTISYNFHPSRRGYEFQALTRHWTRQGYKWPRDVANSAQALGLRYKFVLKPSHSPRNVKVRACSFVLFCFFCGFHNLQR